MTCLVVVDGDGNGTVEGGRSAPDRAIQARGQAGSGWDGPGVPGLLAVRPPDGREGGAPRPGARPGVPSSVPAGSGGRAEGKRRLYRAGGRRGVRRSAVAGDGTR